ncbi:protein MIZU-KUSSEI 1-like [Salvia hispanica]|uniref:protein MIZU-KUSSEI 1-like n=1 Tax=Salvia hispanica TaxID=49212 RepID=UPI00200983A4|nr:protein MIZU-KUSSEI 1-like [Salvia hispanica]
MKTIMAKTPQDSSFSFSRRYFHWKNKDDDEMQEILNFTPKSEDLKTFPMQQQSARARKRVSVLAISKLLGRARSPFSSGRVVGTLFGQRRGHVRFAFQEDFKAAPAFLVELATPTSALVKEMASGLVRIALECEKRAEKKGAKLLEEPVWRTYCNGKKCGYAMRRECGAEEWKVLNSVGPISMGAGVIPGGGEMMYMRAKFERVVGSKDSEAFYMMNPDGNGGPELSIYLLRV